MVGVKPKGKTRDRLNILYLLYNHNYLFVVIWSQDKKHATIIFTTSSIFLIQRNVLLFQKMGKSVPKFRVTAVIIFFFSSGEGQA